jgi:hypothetical protein
VVTNTCFASLNSSRVDDILSLISAFCGPGTVLCESIPSSRISSAMSSAAGGPRRLLISLSPSPRILHVADYYAVVTSPLSMIIWKTFHARTPGLSLRLWFRHSLPHYSMLTNLVFFGICIFSAQHVQEWVRGVPVRIPPFSFSSFRPNLPGSLAFSRDYGSSYR